VEVGIVAPAGSVGVEVVGKEFTVVPVEEGVEVFGRLDSIRFEYRIRLDDAKAVECAEIELLSCESHRLLLRN
jgi:hypothetical protein